MFSTHNTTGFRTFSIIWFGQFISMLGARMTRFTWSKPCPITTKGLPTKLPPAPMPALGHEFDAVAWGLLDWGATQMLSPTSAPGLEHGEK
ncbi:MAG: hypothetical protein KJZ93_04525 [Caldilineaceae bacterium]|nr:hypothetical protein [Caldilineaceae bacterium]